MNKRMRLASATVLAAVSSLTLVSTPASASDPEPEVVLNHCKIGTNDVSARTLVNRIIDNAPGSGSNKYTDPTVAERANIALGAGYLLNGNMSLGADTLRLSGYNACKADMDGLAPFGDGEVTVVYHQDGLLSAAASDGRSVMVFRNNVIDSTDTGIILSAPHTVSEHSIVDINLDAMSQREEVTAAVLSGTHRCASTTNSLDNATTTDCNNHYKISDMAHRWDDRTDIDAVGALSDFQIMHDKLRSHKPNAYMLQMHGMGGTNYGFSISNGNGPSDTQFSTVARAHAAYSAALLSHSLPDDESENLTTCQAYGEVTAVDRKCGEKNDQFHREYRNSGNGDPEHWLHLEISDYIRNNHPNVIQQAFTAIRTP